MSQTPLPNCKYRITPSLLNAFTRYLNPDFEGFWWQDETGGWHRNYDEATDTMHYTPTQVEELALQELIDTINRVESASEAASKGTALNEAVDYIVSRIAPNKHQTECEGDRATNTLTVRQKKLRSNIDPFDDENSFTFKFDREWVIGIADYFADSLCQVEVHAPLETKYGRVELYGFIDYLRGNKVYDLKTTKNYTFGDHAKGWQKLLYPYALIKSDMVEEIQEFEYTIYKWQGGTKYQPNLSGAQFKEAYTFDMDYATKMLTQGCERFIEFLEAHRDVITDAKVFGGLTHSQKANEALELLKNTFK